MNLKLAVATLMVLSGISCTKQTVERVVEKERSNQNPQLMTQQQMGERTGSGGDALVCYNNDGSIKSVRLRDFVEADLHGLDINLGGPELSVIEKLKFLENRVKKFERFYEEIANIGDDDFIEEVEKIWDPSAKDPKVRVMDLKGFQLADIKDDQARLVIGNMKNCNVVQIAIQEDKARLHVPFVYIDKKFWDKMDNDNKAGLLIHEFLLAKNNLYNPDSKGRDSRNARYLTMMVSSSKLEQLSEIEYFEMLEGADFIVAGDESFYSYIEEKIEFKRMFRKLYMPVQYYPVNEYGNRYVKKALPALPFRVHVPNTYNSERDEYDSFKVHPSGLAEFNKWGQILSAYVGEEFRYSLELYSETEGSRNIEFTVAPYVPYNGSNTTYTQNLCGQIKFFDSNESHYDQLSVACTKRDLKISKEVSGLKSDIVLKAGQSFSLHPSGRIKEAVIMNEAVLDGMLYGNNEISEVSVKAKSLVKFNKEGILEDHYQIGE